jgi:hypothetical protein
VSASRLARIATVTLAALVVLLIPSSDARACSCADVGTTPERIIGNDAVFRGTVVDYDVPWTLRPGADRTLDPAWRGTLAYYTDASVTVHLRVHEAWKGVDTREVVLDVGSGFCCDCSLGTDFGRLGEELLVYANMHEGALHVGFCNQPIPIEFAGPHLEALGPGQRSLASGRTGNSGLGTPLQIAGAIALALALALFWMRAHAPKSTPV